MEDEMEREKKIRRQREFLTGFAYWAVWLAGAALFLKFVGPVLLPFFLAFLVAVLLARPVDVVSERMRIKRGTVAVAMVAAFYLLLAAVVYLAGSSLVIAVYDAFTDASSFVTNTLFPAMRKIMAQIGTLAQKWDIAAAQSLGEESAGMLNRAGNAVSELSGNMIDGISEVAAKIPGFCMKVLFAVIATVFMELDYHNMMSFLMRQIPEEKQKTLSDCGGSIKKMLGKCVLSYGAIMGLTFAELCVGFFLLRVDGAVIIAAIIAVLDILPVIGTGTILVPWAVLSIVMGEVRFGIGLLVLYLAITVIRNIVEPKLVGKQMGLSPIVTLPCMFIGLKFFGLLGMIGAPLVAALLKSLNDQGIIRLFR